MSEDAVALLVALAPVLITAATAAIAAPILWSQGDVLRQSWIPGGLLAAQCAMVPLTWVVLWVAPDAEGFNEAETHTTCPTLDGAWAVPPLTLYFGSSIVGGVAVAAALAASRSAGRPLGYAAATVAATYVIGIKLLLAAFCGWA